MKFPAVHVAEVPGAVVKTKRATQADGPSVVVHSLRVLSKVHLGLLSVTGKHGQSE